MIYRRVRGETLGIAQPAHAWLSGQLARAWGNEQFGSFAPHADVCLAAEQHDHGMQAWELNPSLDPATGLPWSFTEMPTREHVALWAAAGPSLLPQSRYAALLVSLHGTGLYARHDFERDSAEEKVLVRRFLEEQADFQQSLVHSLARDEVYASAVEANNLARNRKLLAAWDYLSLAICGAWDVPRKIPGVPAASGDVDLKLDRVKGDELRLSLDPWPFSVPGVILMVEARRIRQGVNWSNAEWVTLRTTVQPSQT